jgi:hypothetical protein
MHVHVCCRNQPESASHRPCVCRCTWCVAWQVCAYALVGFGMNGHEYLGTFDVSLSINQARLDWT